MIKVRSGIGKIEEKVRRDILKLNRRKKLVDRLRKDERSEMILEELIEGDNILILWKKMVIIKRGKEGLGEDVVLKVKEEIDIIESNVKKSEDEDWKRIKEKDMRKRWWKLDMENEIEEKEGKSELKEEFLEDDEIVFNKIVIEEKELIVIDREEDEREEEKIELWIESKVVDSIRIIDIEVWKGKNIIRDGDRDYDGIESLRRRMRIEKINEILVNEVIIKGDKKKCVK